MLLPSGHATTASDELQRTPQSPHQQPLHQQLYSLSSSSPTIGNGLARHNSKPVPSFAGGNERISATVGKGRRSPQTPAAAGAVSFQREIIESAPQAVLSTTAAAPTKTTTTCGSSTTNNIKGHLAEIQDKLKDGWTAHGGKEGRLYYCNHLTQTAGWLPPFENWSQCEKIPYGWERAVDSKGRQYFINHLDKTSTYAAPDYVQYDENPPEPRTVVLQRSSNLGFGFVAGSEKPVIVRFVTDGGPSMNKLQPGDQILAVNGENVREAPRDHVIQLVRACDSQVTLVVCQPNNNPGIGKKSTLLSAGKRAKLRSRPCRVRFAESVCVNGSPLFPPSAFSLGDICVPPMANVLKVFLENGQTKSFKYDATTIVQDVVTSLHDKLCIKAGQHFSLVLEHVKTLKQNKLTILDQEESLARIAARPGAHKLRCLFRVSFVPISAAELAQTDLNALDYLYMQCCNDVTQERFAPELQPEVALRLAALHMHQHALANNISPTKLTAKIVEREFGLERFVPSSLIEGMKRKELRRLIAHFLRLNSQMTGSSTKMLTQLQTKIHYLDIISNLPSYGAKCFSTNQRDVDRVLLVSPHFGLSQISGIRNSVPQLISPIGDITRVIVHRDDDVSCSVGVFLHGDRVVKFSMEDRDASEFALVIAGYYRLLTGKELAVDKEREKYDEDNAPSYLAQHTVLPAAWSYLLPFHNRAHSVNFLMPPHYHADNSHQTQTTTTAATTAATRIASSPHFNRKGVFAQGTTTGGNNVVESFSNNQCDRNMNSKNVANNNHKSTPTALDMSCSTSLDLDIHSVMAMELLEDAKDSGLSDSSGGGSSSAAYCSTDQMPKSGRGKGCSTRDALNEAKNEEVLRRVAEMQRMVENSEQYLNEHGELIQKDFLSMRENRVGGGGGGGGGGIIVDGDGNFRNRIVAIQRNETSALDNGGAPPDLDSDCDSLNSSKVSSNEDAPPPGVLKHSDSLVLLAETINHDLSGITKGLKSIGNGSGGAREGRGGGGGISNKQHMNDSIEAMLSITENRSTTTPPPMSSRVEQQNRVNGLSQLLSNLQSLSNDFSQSESDSESVQSPGTSPTLKQRSPALNGDRDYTRKHNKNANFRTSFGLHSPDSTSIGAGFDAKDYNLKEYLKQLKEISKVDSNVQDTDVAAKKLSEIYGFEIGEDTFIETDSDLIDLRALPPPQTPDELDALSILNAAPQGFRDIHSTRTGTGVNNATDAIDEGDLDRFLAKVIVAPPTQKATPAKELTPEEIMSFIIPPPPNLLMDDNERRHNRRKDFIDSSVSANEKIMPPAREKSYESNQENLYSNSKSISESVNMSNGTSKRQKSYNNALSSTPVIEYATVERKGAFSCCSKSKQEEQTFTVSAPICTTSELHPTNSDDLKLQLPPRQVENFTPPARPPKNFDLQSRYSPIKKQISFAAESRQSLERQSFTKSPARSENPSQQQRPPLLPPRTTTAAAAAAAAAATNASNDPISMSELHLAPKKPPLPPMAARSILRGSTQQSPFPKQIQIPAKSMSPCSPPPSSALIKTATPLGSPHLNRNINTYRDIDTAFSMTQKILKSSPRSTLNGHYRSNSDCPPVCFKTSTPENRPQLSLLCSPQMSRKFQSSPTPQQRHQKNDNTKGSEKQIGTIKNGGFVINGEALLAKTDIAMTGLLVKLDHVAAQCTAAQAAGGGSQIDEEKFQKARNELTEQTLALVTASKLLVVAMSDMTFSMLPEHLTSCLTAIRRITELTQDITRHTSAPLQTRNIVLKVHDVASSFRELAGVQIGPLGAGQLALQAECLANVLATLLRSLRVFSP